jgi:hypothetical protein
MWRAAWAFWLLASAAMGAMEQPARATPEKKVWDVVRSPDGDFAFSMPAKPGFETRKAQGPAGALEVLAYSCTFQDAHYQLQRARSPRSIAPDRVIAELAHLRKGHLKENTRLVKETKIVVDGVIGDDFTYAVPSPKGEGEVTKWARHFLTGQFYYVLTVTSPPGKPLPNDAARFVSSLTFEALVKAHHARMKEGPTTPAQPPTATARPTAPRQGSPRGPSTKVGVADSTPEDALKTFLLALAARDAETLRAVTLPDPDFDWLLKGRPASAEVLAQMKSRLETNPIRRLKAGDPVRMPNGEPRVVQPDDVRDGRAVLWPNGALLPSRVERVGTRWKVFARPFIAARKSAEAKNKPPRSKAVGGPGAAGR